jgi:hypothetical protein
MLVSGFSVRVLWDKRCGGLGFGRVAGWVTICSLRDTVIAADLLFGIAVTRRTSRRARNAR